VSAKTIRYYANNTLDSFLNDSIRLSELAVQRLSHLFKVRGKANFE
jgi:hypothetical protein